MSATALFIFSKECGSCILYKNLLYEQTLKVLAKHDVQHKEYTADTLDGFKPGSVEYAFLEDVKWFPCFMLIKTDVLEQYTAGKFTGDIFEKLFIWNGVVMPKGNQRRIVSVSPQPYGYTEQETERFYSDFEQANFSKSKLVNNKTKELTRRDISSNSKETVTTLRYSTPMINTLDYRNERLGKKNGIMPVRINKK